MWPVTMRSRSRRSVSPAFYSGYDNLDLFRGYPSYDNTSLGYGYGYGLGGYGLPMGLGEHTEIANGVEMATRQHAAAQSELEKAKEKYDEAKKKFEECEKKVKAAEDVLRTMKMNAAYAT